MLTALITGGSRGIGAATVRLFASSGYQVAFTYRSSHVQAAQLSAQTGAQAIACDLSQTQSVSDAMAQALSLLGHVDVLVNNAGIAHTGLLTDLVTAQWDQLFAVNVRGAFLCA